MTDLRVEIAQAAAVLGARDLVDGVYASEILSARPWARLARSRQGYALALPGDAGPPSPELRLEHLRIRFNIQCQIEAHGAVRSERLTIVECLSSDPRLQDLFLDVVAVVLPSSEIDVPWEVRTSVTALAELFRTMLVSGPKSVLGLWGELFAMARGLQPGLAAGAWHTTPRDRYDFAAGSLRVEVKTTTGTRAHHFSLDQLRPPSGTRALVISIVTTVSPAGPSIQELLDRVAHATADDVRNSLVVTAMSSLGASWPDASRARFDGDLAEATVRWYNSETIPRVADPPPEVTNVHFVSDLQACDWLAEERVPAMGPLATALAAG